MRWDTVIPTCVVAPIMADSDAKSVLGATPAFFMKGERKFQVGSMQWQLIANTESENYETSLVQIDFHVRTLAQVRTLERALRRLLHHETEVTIGGLDLWSTYVDARPLPGAVDGNLARSLDFELKYLRARYVAA